MNRSPNNTFIKGQYFLLKKIFKKTCRNAKRNFEQALLNSLENLQETNPNGFWDMLKKFKSGRLEKNFQSKILSLNHLCFVLDHYKNLLQTKETTSGEEKENFNGNVIGGLQERTQFNEKITVDEIKNASRRLKSKTPGDLDSILSEMIKCSNTKSCYLKWKFFLI